MKMKLFWIGLASVVLSAGVVRAEESAAPEVSNTRTAEVSLKIVTDPRVFPMDNNLGNILNLLSAQRINDAGLEVVGASETDWFHGSTLLDGPKEIGGLQTARIRWSIVLDEKDKPAAKELAENLVKKVKDALNDEYIENFSILERKHDVYSYRIEEAQSRLEDLIAKQNNLGQGALDKESVRQRMLEHEKARIENEMQMAILDKRSSEIFNHMSDIQAKADSILNDSKLKELEDRLKQQLSETEANVQLGISDKELRNRIEESKMQLAERKGLLEQEMAERIRQLAEQHRELLMQVEELKIKHNILRGYNPGSLSDSMQYEVLEVRIDAARETLRRALIEGDEFDAQMALIQAPVVIEKITCSQPLPKQID
jgi:hypothetical protein